MTREEYELKVFEKMKQVRTMTGISYTLAVKYQEPECALMVLDLVEVLKDEYVEILKNYPCTRKKKTDEILDDEVFTEDSDKLF